MELADLLDSSREEDIQAYLAHKPTILLHAFGAGALIAECLPKFRFGRDFVSDFVIVRGESFYYEVVLVELEPATARPFTLSGRPGRRLNEAISQIDDWLGWIATNSDYFKRTLASEVSSGYARRQLLGVTHHCQAIIRSKIVIGRRQMFTERNNQRRATIMSQSRHGLEILPYDRLAEIERGDYDRDPKASRSRVSSDG